MGFFDNFNLLEKRREEKRMRENRQAQIETELLLGTKQKKIVSKSIASEIAREKILRLRETQMVGRDIQLQKLKRLEQDRKTKKAILEKRTALISNIAANLGIKAEPKSLVKAENIQELDQSKVNIGRITVFNRKAWNAEKQGIDFGSGNADLGMAASSEPQLSPFNQPQINKNVWTLGNKEE